MKPQVDRNLEEIYTSILVEKLQKPEEWKKAESGDDKFESSPIPGTRTYFRTAGKYGTDYIVDKVTIRSITSRSNYDSEIYTLKVDRWRVKRLMRKMIRYMELKNEWSHYEKIDNLLKEALPENIDRYLKLTKIRKKI